MRNKNTPWKCHIIKSGLKLCIVIVDNNIFIINNTLIY